MKKNLLLSACFFVMSLHLQAQIQIDTSPNFTVTDINGVEYDLYDILASDRPVFLDLMATWCAPCWVYHESGIMHDFYETYGPDGTNEAMVFMVDIDPNTTMEDLMGTGNATAGDWITGTIYPIVDDSRLGSIYQVSFVPTLLKICPDRSIRAFDATYTVEDLAAIMNECVSYNDLVTNAQFYSDYQYGCGMREVQFVDDSWPVPDAWLWDFGDGNTSTESNPSHTYDTPGDFTVSLTTSNSLGSNTETKIDYILIGNGDAELDVQNVGLALNSQPWTGHSVRGNHGLKFDVFNDMVLSSVKVYAEGAGDRVIIVRDSSGVLLSRREVFIPEGEQRVQLDFYIPPGEAYRLGFQSDADLWFSTDGFEFPFTIDSLVSITGGTHLLNHYHFFYDWEVRELGCTGEMVATQAIIPEPLRVYPNPASSHLLIEGDALDGEVLYIRNTLGQILWTGKVNGATLELDVSNFTNGLYLISVGSETYKFVKQE